MLKFLKNLVYNYKEYFWLVFLLIFSLSIIPLNQNKSVKKAKSIAFGITAAVNSLPGLIEGLFRNESELNSLRLNNAKLMLENSLLRERVLENRELKMLLALKDSSSQKLTAASIVSKVISSTDGSYIINVGRKDSIKIGMPVITELGLAGIVYNVANDFSYVKAFSNTSLKFAVKNQRSRFESIAKWNGKKLIITNVPITSDNKVGDRIVTSEFSTIVPPNIPVGIITEFGQVVAGSYSSVTLVPFNNYETIKNIFVLNVVKSVQIDSLELNLLRSFK